MHGGLGWTMSLPIFFRSRSERRAFECINARSLLVRALGASLLARLPAVGPFGPGSLRPRRVQ